MSDKGNPEDMVDAMRYALVSKDIDRMRRGYELQGHETPSVVEAINNAAKCLQSRMYPRKLYPYEAQKLIKPFGKDKWALLVEMDVSIENRDAYFKKDIMGNLTLMVPPLFRYMVMRAKSLERLYEILLCLDIIKPPVSFMESIGLLVDDTEKIKLKSRFKLGQLYTP